MRSALTHVRMWWGLRPAPVFLLVCLLTDQPARCGAPATTRVSDPPPILVTFDLHMDPLHAIPDVRMRRHIYESWRDAADWLLDQTESRGAKLSFSTCGEFAEFCLEDAERAFPLIRRLHESGGSIGTHTHRERRIGPHQWRDIPPFKDPLDVDKVWNDAIIMVDRLVSRSLGIADSARVRAVNNLRGSHVPQSDAERLAMMVRWGFAVHQSGPDEDFFALFHHHLMNPYRPSATNIMANDPNTPVVIVPAGPVLGRNSIHKGIRQDMSPPALKARFLLVVLNWLNDTDARIWNFGWAVHGSDIVPGRGVSRECIVPLLDWFDRNFIGRKAAGRPVAQYGSYRQAEQMVQEWEKEHPGKVSVSYAGKERNWDLYPYLKAACIYLWDASYDGPVDVGGRAIVHRVVAGSAVGGPFPVHVAWPVGREPVIVHTARLGEAEWKVVDPSTGAATAAQNGKLPVGPNGAIIVESQNVIDVSATQARLAKTDTDPPSRSPDRRRNLAGPTRQIRQPSPAEFISRFDRNGDGKVGRDEWPGPARVFEQTDGNSDGFIDSEEAKTLPPPPRRQTRPQ